MRFTHGIFCGIEDMVAIEGEAIKAESLSLTRIMHKKRRVKNNVFVMKD